MTVKEAEAKLNQAMRAWVSDQQNAEKRAAWYAADAALTRARNREADSPSAIADEVEQWLRYSVQGS